jgi:hypothetical protein
VRLLPARLSDKWLFCKMKRFPPQMKRFVEKATYKSLADGESCTYVFFSNR